MELTSKLLVCVKGKHCNRRNSPSVFKQLKMLIEECELDKVFKLKKSDCFGLCEHGPVVKFKPDGHSYLKVTKDDCVDIIRCHIDGSPPEGKLNLMHKKKR